MVDLDSQRSDPTVLWTAATIYLYFEEKHRKSRNYLYDLTHTQKKCRKKSKPAELCAIMWMNSISGLASITILMSTGEELRIPLPCLSHRIQPISCVWLKSRSSSASLWFPSHNSTLIYICRAVPTEDVILLGLPLLLPTTLLLETHSRLLNIHLDTPLCQKNLSIALHPSEGPLPQDKDAIFWPQCSNMNSFACVKSKFSCFLLPSLVSSLHLPILGSEVDPAYPQTSPTSQIFKSGHDLMPSILHFSLMAQAD